MTPPEQRSTSVDNMSNDQLAAFARTRASVAELMTPYMLGGISRAQRLADSLDINDADTRYIVLAEASTELLKDAELRRRYDRRFPEFAGSFPSHEAYRRIHDRQFPALIGAAVMDARWTGLSAARFLEEQSRGGEAPAIIPRSLGLLAVTGAHKDRLAQLRDQLGDPIDPEHLTLRTTPAIGEQIGFTTEAKEIIKQFPSRFDGCPALAIADPRPDGNSLNLLTAYWEEISKYAFPGTQ